MTSSINKHHPPHISGNSAFKQLQSKWPNLFWSSFKKKTFTYCIVISNAVELKLFLVDFKRVVKKYKLKNLNLSMKVDCGLMAQKETVKLINSTTEVCLCKPRFYSLEYIGYHSGNDGSEILYYKMFKKLRNLRILSLIFSQYSTLENRDIGMMFKNINKHAKHLKELSFELPDCKTFQTKRSRKAGINLKKLQNLYINFEKFKTSSLLIQRMSKTIGRNLLTLASLSFNMNSCSIKENLIKPFTDNLCSKLKYLQKAEFNFSKNPNITDQHIIYLCLNFGLRNENLQELYLNFSECEVKKSDEAYCLMDLKKDSKTKLRVLSLNFEKSFLPLDADSNFLSKVLEASPYCLEQLILNFESCTFGSDKWINQFGQSLSLHKNNLKAFEMNMSWYRGLTDEHLSLFGSDVLGPLNALESVKIHFSWSPNVTDLGLQQFIIFLENKRNLKYLQLYLEGFTKVTSNGVATIGAGLSHIQELKSLNLSFRGYLTITDNSVDVLSLTITKNLKALESLSLDFRGCVNLSNKSLGFLGLSLSSSHKNIKELSLNFARCAKMTQKGVEKLKKRFTSKQSSLQKLSLNFGDCPQVLKKSERIEFQNPIRETNILKRPSTSPQLSCNIF